MKTVLIADDDADVRLVLGLPLEAQRYRVVEATSGPELLEQATRERPDLVIMDWNMPGMPGADVIRALQSGPATAGLPVIVLTGETNEADVARCRQLGVWAYLIKPVAMKELIDTVNTALADAKRPPTAP